MKEIYIISCFKGMSQEDSHEYPVAAFEAKEQAMTVEAELHAAMRECARRAHWSADAQNFGPYSKEKRQLIKEIGETYPILVKYNEVPTDLEDLTAMYDVADIPYVPLDIKDK